ncbi:MAG: protein kinase [Gemmatimonadota bacterium]|nr:protein kinase [Gemmatimonadota bacterium]
MTAVTQRLHGAIGDRYRIERELGAGGMATVYLAHDVRHDRKVALKVLRPELAAVLGAERFLNEIRVTANLQHPHILPLFDSGEAESLLFYVMPYLEGESLRQRVDRERQLGVEEAVRLAQEVAAALDYAHRQNVVHRDIKPANILLHDGSAQVADFGIALALRKAGGDRLTQTGLSLGTPHYMSPEQATGDRDIDARTDIYSLGAVLYEMLAGEPPHTGGTIQAVISKVVTEVPKPLGDLRHSVPAHVAMAVEKALAKIPADRFATAADFATALKTPGFTLASARTTRAESARGAGRTWSAVLPTGWPGWVTVALVAAAGIAAGLLLGRPAAPAPAVGRFVIETDSGVQLSGAPVSTVALSPDGRNLVYVGATPRGSQLHLRRLEDLTVTPIAGTEGGVGPFFTPDGEAVGFFVGGGVRKVALSGGAPITIPGAPNTVFTQWAVWLDNESLVITAGDGSLHRVSPDGTSALIARPDSANGETSLNPTAALPDGRTVLVTAATQGGVNGRGVAIDVASGERHTILDGPINAMSYDGGSLVWAQPDGTLLGAVFDPKALRITGSPVTLAQGVRVSVGGPAQFYVSQRGSLVYVPELPFRLMMVDRTGRPEFITDVQRRFHSPRFSPDGRRVAVDFTQQGSRDVWSLDLGQRTLTRLTFDDDGHDPVWTRDGRVAYATSRGGNIGIFMRNADGSGVAESVYVGTTAAITAGAFAIDGKHVATIALGTAGSWDIGLLPLDGSRTPEPLLATPFNEGWPAISPDGRWLAYQSDESGQFEVYVRPLTGRGAKVLVSQNGGSEPVWNPDGRELFYRGIATQGSPIMSATIRTSPEFQVLSRTTLFDAASYEQASPHANYDVSPDGRRFVMVHQGELSRIVVILNWIEEVRRRSGAGR